MLRARLRAEEALERRREVAGRQPVQAACQRRSTSSRSQASRSDSPSKAWGTMTVAIARAGMVGRPFFESVERSAK